MRNDLISCIDWSLYNNAAVVMVVVVDGVAAATTNWEFNFPSCWTSWINAAKSKANTNKGSFRIP